MKPPRSSTFWLASALFLGSGALGLGYELIWVKKAALVVGASQIALSTVLTAFFLGLGLGSYFVGRYLRSSRRSPLFVYGLFELAIGIFAVAFPHLFSGLEALYGALYGLVADSDVGLFVLRFGLLFGLFLVPTFFMGGTLPLLLDGLVDRDQSIGSRTSFLYGTNILGAVAGVLLTAYFAIPALGMNGSSVAFGCGNLLLGAAALVSFRRLEPLYSEDTVDAGGKLYPTLAFASGLLAIGYQIAWARYFSLFNTANVYLTALLLAVYLLALAVGSFIIAPLLAARWSPLRILAIAQGLVPVLVYLGLEGWRLAEHRYALKGQRLPSGAVVPIDTLEIDPAYRYFSKFLGEDLDAIFTAPFLQVGLVIFLPVALLGMGLPTLMAAATDVSRKLRATSGKIIFWNTLGSGAGGFVTGYGLVPLLGLHGTLCCLGLGSAGLSAAASFAAARAAPAASGSRRESRAARRKTGGDAAFRKSEPSEGRSRVLSLVPAVLGALVALSVTFLSEDVTKYTIRYHGYGRDPEVGYDPDAPDPKAGARMRLSAVREGPLTTAFLFEDDRSVRVGSGNVCLAVAYKDALCSQALQGHIPCIFYPGTGLPRDCLGICLGSGQSFGALLLYPIERLDVVDISREIVDLSLRHFEPFNHGLATDARARIHMDDGRHFVERAETASYDVVSMEPPPPAEEGVASLYSLEFYEEVRRILREGGVFMQWLPLYRVTPLDARGIVRTQTAVFPETFVVKVFADDFMVVSYKQRPVFPVASIRERLEVLEQERLISGFRWNPSCAHDIASLEGMLSLLVSGPEACQALEGPGPYHDDNQLLSYTSGDRRLLRRYEGPALSRLSFAAVPLSDYSRLAGYFDPPIDAQAQGILTVERAMALQDLGMADPRIVANNLRILMGGKDAEAKGLAAVELAAAADIRLDKDAAFAYLEQAVKLYASAGMTPPGRSLEVARAVTRNRLAAYELQVSNWILRLKEVDSGSMIVAAAIQELSQFKARESARIRRYWFR